MQISRHWRLNSQRYRLEGVRYQNGDVSFQNRPVVLEVRVTQGGGVEKGRQANEPKPQEEKKEDLRE
ncbi:hypothetical protein KBD71_02715 [Candidatus Woesebacteria bacterium]|nr:hypothetical protein [Candidatus Woesebacteria bacterium]